MYKSVSLFWDVMWPREQISSGMFMHLNPTSSMSAARNSYLSRFLLLAAPMFLVKGMVSSTRITELGTVDLSTMTKSGLCVVTI